MLIEILKSLSPSMAKNDVRYYLMGIHIKYANDTYTFESTDGHIASRITLSKDQAIDHNIVHNERDTEFDIIVRDDQVQDILRGVTKRSHLLLHVCNSDINFNKNGYSIPHYKLDGRFPDLNRVIPKDNRIPSLEFGIGLSSELLKTLHAAAKPFASTKLAPIKLHFGGETDCIKAEIPNTHGFNIICILMPSRMEDRKRA